MKTIFLWLIVLIGCVSVISESVYPGKEDSPTLSDTTGA